MRREFVQHFGVKSGILREAYRCLTGDKFAPNCLTEAEVDERIRKVLDEEDPILAWDLRVTSSGRPEQYMDFLTSLILVYSFEITVLAQTSIYCSTQKYGKNQNENDGGCQAVQAEHVDAYYASKIFRYQKEFSVKFRDVTTFICQDDKCTGKVGEPGRPLAAVERRKSYGGPLSVYGGW